MKYAFSDLKQMIDYDETKEIASERKRNKNIAVMSSA